MENKKGRTSSDGRFAKATNDRLFEYKKKPQNQAVVDPRFAKINTDPDYQLATPKAVPKEEEAEEEYDENPADPAGEEFEEEAQAEGEAYEGYEGEGGAEEEEGEGEEAEAGSSADSSEDSEGSFSDDELVEMEVDYSAEEVDTIPEGQETSRLAVLNCDWDHLSALDLLAALTPFLPTSGVIHKVSVYLSHFGQEKLEVESRFGPDPALWAKPKPAQKGKKEGREKAEKEVEEEQGQEQEQEEQEAAPAEKKKGKQPAGKKGGKPHGKPQGKGKKGKKQPEPEPEPSESGSGSESGSEADSESSDGERTLRPGQVDRWGFNKEKLRAYEKEKLRYYFALVECDSAKTANALYQACDSVEFEQTAAVFDMRFVPDGLEMDTPVRDSASELAEVIENRTIQHTNPMLTWDLPSVSRLRVTTKKFTKEDLKEMDFTAYLASSDVEDDERDRLAQGLKGLLGEMPQDEEQDELRITFTPGLSQKIQAGMREKEFEKEMAAATVFERKKMEKQRRKRLEREQAKEAEEAEGSDEIDYNDPFGDGSMMNMGGGRGGDSDSDGGRVKRKSEGKSKKYKKKRLNKAEAAEQAKAKAELQLLMMDEKDSGEKRASGFSLKHLLDDNKTSKAAKKRKEKRQKAKGEDQFEISMDDRWSKLKEPEFYIDQTNPKFKRTKAMEKVLQTVNSERQKRQEQAERMGGDKDLADLVSRLQKRKAPAADPAAKRQKQ